MSTQVVLSLIGVVLGVSLVIFMSFKGFSTLMSAVLSSIIILLFSGLNVVDGVVSVYADGFGSQVVSVLVLYYGCCVFSAVMNSTRSTHAIANWIGSLFGVKHAPTALILVGLVLRLGGLSTGAYILIFDLGIVLLSKANYSEDMLMAAIVGSCMTFVNTSPFFPSVHNTLIMNAWGTSTSAGMIPGLASSIIQVVATCAVLEIAVRRWAGKGRVFSAWDLVKADDEKKEEKDPNIILALIPIVCVVVTYNVLAWELPACMAVSSLLCMLLNLRKFTA